MHSFDPEIAKLVGVNAAVIYQNILWWAQKNAANEKHFHDGRYWTYNSITAFESLFPYLTSKQIRSALVALEEAQLIVCGNYNQSTYDRTKWYSPNGQIDLPCRANGIAPEGRPIPVSKPVGKQSSIMELPDWLPKDAWDGWVAMRKQIKKPASERAMKMAIKKLEELSRQGHDPGQVLDQSTMSSWTDLYPIKQEVKSNGKRAYNAQPNDGLSSTARAALSVFGSDGEDYEPNPSQQGGVQKPTDSLSGFDRSEWYDRGSPF